MRCAQRGRKTLLQMQRRTIDLLAGGCQSSRVPTIPRAVLRPCHQRGFPRGRRNSAGRPIGIHKPKADAEQIEDEAADAEQIQVETDAHSTLSRERVSVEPTRADGPFCCSLFPQISSTRHEFRLYGTMGEQMNQSQPESLLHNVMQPAAARLCSRIPSVSDHVKSLTKITLPAVQRTMTLI